MYTFSSTKRTYGPPYQTIHPRKAPPARLPGGLPHDALCAQSEGPHGAFYVSDPAKAQVPGQEVLHHRQLHGAAAGDGQRKVRIQSGLSPHPRLPGAPDQ